MKPPSRQSVAAWADEFATLPTTSAEPGRYRTSRVPYFKEVMEAFTDNRINRVVVKSASQMGKALDIETPIATPEGFKFLQDINAGDKVFDERGQECNVLWATPIMYGHECYEVTFSDGAKIVADAEHQWIVDGRLLTTLELKEGMELPEVKLTALLLNAILRRGEGNEEDLQTVRGRVRDDRAAKAILFAKVQSKMAIRAHDRRANVCCVWQGFYNL